MEKTNHFCFETTNKYQPGYWKSISFQKRQALDKLHSWKYVSTMCLRYTNSGHKLCVGDSEQLYFTTGNLSVWVNGWWWSTNIYISGTNIDIFDSFNRSQFGSSIQRPSILLRSPAFCSAFVLRCHERFNDQAVQGRVQTALGAKGQGTQRSVGHADAMRPDSQTQLYD